MKSITIYQVTKEDLLNFFMDISNQQLSQKKEEKYLTVSEVMKMTGKARSTLWTWERKGYLVPSRIGKELRYLQSDIINLMSNKSENRR